MQGNAQDNNQDSFKMKKLIALLFLISNVQAQVSIEQDERNIDQLKIQHVLVDNTDGYTGETGLSPTCKISIPGATDASACSNSAVELDATDAPGVYRVTLAASEWETPGIGMMVLTGTGAIPSRVPFTIRPSKLYTNQNLLLYPNNLAGSGWTLTAATVTQNSTADFNGDTIGDTLTADGTNAQHYIYTSSSVKRRGGSGFYVSSVEVKYGTADSVWVGDNAWGAGLDWNMVTQTASPSTGAYLRGWRVENIGSSWYRVSILYQVPTSDSTYTVMTLGIGNGTAGGSPPTFTSSGTAIFARATHSRAEDVPPEQLTMILPSLQSASSSSSVTLAASELNSNQFMRNREICFILTNGTTMGYAQCACIVDYDGSTKVANITPSLTTTLSSTYKYRMGGICPSKVNVGSVDTDAIGAGALAANAIGASEMADGAIDAGALASDTITAAKIAADSIGASEVAADAIGASELAADAIASSEIATTGAQEIADVTLRRSTANVEASSHGDTLGFKSVYGMTAQQTHKTTTGSGVQTVYKNDGTTSLNTRSYSSNPSAEPITGLD